MSRAEANKHNVLTKQAFNLKAVTQKTERN